MGSKARLNPSLLSEIKLNKPELLALFKNLGGPGGPGEARLQEILRDFYRRMSSDVLVGFFFAGKATDAIADRQREFLLRAMGATPSYSGKAPAQAHDEIAPILTGHFDRRLRILEETLRDHGLSDRDVETWLTFENAFRDAIVQKEK